MLTNEPAGADLLQRVLYKEYLARRFEQGKITPENYLNAVNGIRAAEQLPPLTSVDLRRQSKPAARSRRSKRPSK